MAGGRVSSVVSGVARPVVHVGRAGVGGAGVALVVVDVLAGVLVVAGAGLPQHGVGSAGHVAARRIVRILGLGPRPLQHRRQVAALLAPQPRLEAGRAAGPEAVAAHHAAAPRPRQLPVGEGRVPGGGVLEEGGVTGPAPHYRLHLLDVDGRDGAGVHHGLRPVGRGGPGLVPHQARPLLRQTHELVVAGIEAGVDAVLEVGGGGDLRLFLLF